MRYLPVAVAMLVLGAAAGGGFQYFRMNTALTDSQSAHDAAREKATQLESRIEKLQESMSDLEYENESLKDEVHSLESAGRKDAEAAGSRPSETELNTLWADIMSEMQKGDNGAKPAKQDAKAKTPAETKKEKKKEKKAEPRTEAQKQADRSARGKESRRQFQERMSDFFQREAANAKDATAQQRIATLQGSMGALAELRDALKSTEDPEMRRQLREQSAQVIDQVRGLMLEQQDQMLREVATRYGITDPLQQDSFISSLRGVESTPYFHSGQLMRSLAPKAPAAPAAPQPANGKQ